MKYKEKSILLVLFLPQEESFYILPQMSFFYDAQVES